MWHDEEQRAVPEMVPCMPDDGIEECAVICDGLESTWPKSGADFGICAAAIRAAKQ